MIFRSPLLTILGVGDRPEVEAIGPCRQALDEADQEWYHGVIPVLLLYAGRGVQYRTDVRLPTSWRGVERAWGAFLNILF